MKYLVVATKYDEVNNKYETYVAGMFDCYILARMFRNVYNNTFTPCAEIVDINDIWR